MSTTFMTNHLQNNMSFGSNGNQFSPGYSSGSNSSQNFSPGYGNAPSPVEMFYRRNSGKISGYNKSNRNMSPYHTNTGPWNSMPFNNQSPRQLDNGRYCTSTPRFCNNSINNTSNNRYTTPQHNRSMPHTHPGMGSPYHLGQRYYRAPSNTQMKKMERKNFRYNQKFNGGQKDISSYFTDSMIEDPWSSSVKKIVKSNFQNDDKNLCTDT